MSYDRYAKFRNSGTFDIVPGIKIPVKDTDTYEVYKLNETRLDLLSYKHYSDPNYDWLIMLANPEYGSMEFSIPDGANLRIPYPLLDSLKSYVAEVEKYNRLYK